MFFIIVIIIVIIIIIITIIIIKPRRLALGSPGAAGPSPRGHGVFAASSAGAGEGAYYLGLSLVTLKCHMLMYDSTLYHIIP